MEVKYPRIIASIVIFIASGGLSAVTLFGVHFAGIRIGFGVPPLYFPLAGVWFAIAFLSSLYLYTGQLNWRTSFLVLFFSVLGMDAAATSYVWVRSGDYGYQAEMVFMGISSLAGGLVTLVPTVGGVQRKLLYFVVGTALAYVIGALNTVIQTTSGDNWGMALNFNSLALCVSWQVMMGLYMLLLGGGRGLVLSETKQR